MTKDSSLGYREIEDFPDQEHGTDTVPPPLPFPSAEPLVFSESSSENHAETQPEQRIEPNQGSDPIRANDESFTQLSFELDVSEDESLKLTAKRRKRSRSAQMNSGSQLSLDLWNQP